jgi:hypothetical protein
MTDEEIRIRLVFHQELVIVPCSIMFPSFTTLMLSAIVMAACEFEIEIPLSLKTFRTSQQYGEYPLDPSKERLSAVLETSTISISRSKKDDLGTALEHLSATAGYYLQGNQKQSIKKRFDARRHPVNRSWGRKA